MLTIRLVGPGGAGKSTVGGALASRLELPFLDLDTSFSERVGDISHYIDRCGYEAYARQNIDVYLSVGADKDGRGVIALSSGFMTYPMHIHPMYADVRSSICASPTTFVLLPSLDRELCVAETVRRQVGRPFGRSADREEAVIRERYAAYIALAAPNVETMRPPAEVADEIAGRLPPINSGMQPATRSALHWKR